MECKKCNSKDIEEDEARAEMICQGCGEVCEVNDIQGVTEFHEMENGKIVALGKTVYTQEAKQNTINKAQEKIEGLCSKLSLERNLAAYAIRIFKSVLRNGLTRGKKSSIMTGACVYLAARINHRSIMLLDISDKINENVYTLGKVYNQIKLIFGQKVADIDPCMFINRFANDLDLGDKKEVVCMTALKLLQRMKKDWISTGRRPSGITAAALLIASRIHHFDRNYEDVARIAGISKSTAKKRLQEWSETSTASLTLSQFKTIDYEEEFDPPSFSENKLKANTTLKLEISEEEFAMIQDKIRLMQKQLTELENDDTETDTRSDQCLSQLLDSVEQGVVDVSELIGDVEDVTNTDGIDYKVELTGRRNLVSECIGRGLLRQVFGDNLSKKEEQQNDDEELISPCVGAQLPMTMAIADSGKPDWLTAGNAVGDDALNMDGIDDDELRSLYLSNPKESIKKIHYFLKVNNSYYHKKNLAQQRKDEKKEKDEKSGRKPRMKRARRNHSLLAEAEQLLREIKPSLMGDNLQQSINDDADNGSDVCGSPPAVKKFRLSIAQGPATPSDDIGYASRESSGAFKFEVRDSGAPASLDNSNAGDNEEDIRTDNSNQSDNASMLSSEVAYDYEE